MHHETGPTEATKNRSHSGGTFQSDATGDRASMASTCSLSSPVWSRFLLRLDVDRGSHVRRVIVCSSPFSPAMASNFVWEMDLRVCRVEQPQVLGFAESENGKKRTHKPHAVRGLKQFGKIDHVYQAKPGKALPRSCSPD